MLEGAYALLPPSREPAASHGGRAPLAAGPSAPPPPRPPASPPALTDIGPAVEVTLRNSSACTDGVAATDGDEVVVEKQQPQRLPVEPDSQVPLVLPGRAAVERVFGGGDVGTPLPLVVGGVVVLAWLLLVGVDHDDRA